MLARIMHVLAGDYVLSPGGATWCSQGRKALESHCGIVPEPRRGDKNPVLKVMSPLRGFRNWFRRPPGPDGPG